jgi:hypothetical protein
MATAQRKMNLTFLAVVIIKVSHYFTFYKSWQVAASDTHAKAKVDIMVTIMAIVFIGSASVVDELRLKRL